MRRDLPSPARIVLRDLHVAQRDLNRNGTCGSYLRMVRDIAFTHQCRGTEQEMLSALTPIYERLAAIEVVTERLLG